MQNKRQAAVAIVSAVFLALALGFTVGWAMEKFHFWPWSLVDEAQTALRSLARYGAIIPEGRRVKAPDEASRGRFTVHERARMPGGFYVIAGWGDADSRYAAWLYRGDGQLLHEWPLVYDDLDPDDPRGGDDSPHGFDVLPDGSVLVNFDHGKVMARLDACGKPLWTKRGIYHHLLSRAADGSYWVWRGDGATPYGHFHYLENFDVETGGARREIALIEDVLRGSGTASIILGVRPDQEFRKFDADPDRRSDTDLFHPNDVEELDPALAPQFPMFEAGDLLVSIRRINLVAVLDGTDGRPKWWSHGPWISQHDADFTADGRISVYNNNTGRGRSEIVRIDPATRAVENLPAEGAAAFYSPYMGQHQYLPNGDVLVAAPGEGRVLQISTGGELVMEFNNVASERPPLNDHVENAVWLPEGYFSAVPTCRRTAS
jgi:hypothetical protein